jgi:hypothetical protein
MVNISRVKAGGRFRYDGRFDIMRFGRQFTKASPPLDGELNLPGINID